MIEKIKHYYLVIATLAIAILTFLFLRRGEKIRDLQREAVLKRLNDEFDRAIEKQQINEKEYYEALKNYKRIRSSYDRLFPND